MGDIPVYDKQRTFADSFHDILNRILSHPLHIADQARRSAKSKQHPLAVRQHRVNLQFTRHEHIETFQNIADQTDGLLIGINPKLHRFNDPGLKNSVQAVAVYKLLNLLNIVYFLQGTSSNSDASAKTPYLKLSVINSCSPIKGHMSYLRKKPKKERKETAVSLRSFFRVQEISTMRIGDTTRSKNIHTLYQKPVSPGSSPARFHAFPVNNVTIKPPSGINTYAVIKSNQSKIVLPPIWNGFRIPVTERADGIPSKKQTIAVTW